MPLNTGRIISERYQVLALLGQGGIVVAVLILLCAVVTLGALVVIAR